MDKEISFNDVFCAMVTGMGSKGHTDPAHIANEAFLVAEAAMKRVETNERLETYADKQKKQNEAEKQAALVAQGKGPGVFQRPASV